MLTVPLLAVTLLPRWTPKSGPPPLAPVPVMVTLLPAVTAADNIHTVVLGRPAGSAAAEDDVAAVAGGDIAAKQDAKALATATASCTGDADGATRGHRADNVHTVIV